MNKMLSDLPTEIANMPNSSTNSPDPSPSVDKGNISEDCELALEGGPELEGSPCVNDATNSSSRVLEYVCLNWSDLGTDFLETLALEGDGC